MKAFRPIKKILIANRGEIACRIMGTCQKLGIKTVAVYSEADARALHVEMADQSFLIGPPSPRESYLKMDKLIAVAKQCGADAIHPGYGFLSENEDFAAACAENDIVFIGPPASAIQAMGGKSEAKALMEKAGVPLVPGYHGDRQDEKFLGEQAAKIGFPVLIKASAGGGGKGMRVVETAAAFAEQLAGAKREASAAFGDDHVLIEKYLANPRHVEIQVFADAHGNTVYLFERDCSIQRRHQKVLEEAPAPGVSKETRASMGQAAVAAAKAIGYVGAGTVEFLLDDQQHFYFMEMNTRLQVEHPVTELITGLDLVEMQIRAAEGDLLPFTQEDLEINGHAIEVRLYAEDPANNFLPGAGQIKFLRFPDELGTARIDTGVRECIESGVEGDLISIHYDPMIAKIIVWGEDRDIAIENLKDALSSTLIAGPKNNLAFLRRLAEHPAFKAGAVSTSFIKTHEADLLPQSVSKIANVDMAIAVAGILKAREEEVRKNTILLSDKSSPWNSISNWRIGQRDQEVFTFKKGEEAYSVTAAYQDKWAKPKLLFADGSATEIFFEFLDGYQAYDVHIDGQSYHAALVMDGNNAILLRKGQQEDFTYHAPLSYTTGEDESAGKLTAPMPGKVVAVRVQLGDSVKKGQPLVIVEAMKMEHTIMAPADGIVEKIHAGVGDQVDERYELIALK